ncbi:MULTISPECIES: SIP domain-containing protein [unclassified Moraxella]|uniref:SIP domain-containing protein n=1 Tax=unclassified Moraxella TaxID=2685852 RepID=UPI003AF49BB2
MHTQNLTPFNALEIAEIIEHINEDHLDDMKNMAMGLLGLSKAQQKSLQKVMLQQIYQQGLLLDLQFEQGDKNQHSQHSQQSQFLAFDQTIESLELLNEQYVILLQRSDRKQGKQTIEIQQRQFVLQSVSQVSQNIYRLTVQSTSDLSTLPAGYAFLFDVRLSNTDLTKYPRPYRYYTLRKAWQQVNPQGETQYLAWLDVYCHGEKNAEISLGETWVKSLQADDVILSEREFPEKLEHLMGQSLLIADETSLPTVARLLELWQQPLPPVVMVYLQDEKDLAYLDEVINQQSAKVSPVILPVIANHAQTAHEQIFATLNDFLASHSLKIDSVWGGLEAQTTKKLRPMLCDVLQMHRENMVVKVYWRAD